MLVYYLFLSLCFFHDVRSKQKIEIFTQVTIINNTNSQLQKTNFFSLQQQINSTSEPKSSTFEDVPNIPLEVSKVKSTSTSQSPQTTAEPSNTNWATGITVALVAVCVVLVGISCCLMGIILEKTRHKHHTKKKFQDRLLSKSDTDLSNQTEDDEERYFNFESDLSYNYQKHRSECYQKHLIKKKTSGFNEDIQSSNYANFDFMLGSKISIFESSHYLSWWTDSNYAMIDLLDTPRLHTLTIDESETIHSSNNSTLLNEITPRISIFDEVFVSTPPKKQKQKFSFEINKPDQNCTNCKQILPPKRTSGILSKSTSSLLSSRRRRDLQKSESSSSKMIISFGSSINSKLDNQYLLKDTDIEIYHENQIGCGKFGLIYRGSYRGAKCAVKVMTGDVLKYTNLFEISLHPHICRYFGIYVSPDSKNHVVMEFYEDGSVLSNMQNGYQFLLEQKIDICRQISSGLLHLHALSILHGDLALRNILIDLSKNHVVIADFGLSRHTSDTSLVFTISPRWCAPELLKTRKMTRNTDIYALGVTFNEIFEDGKIPYQYLTLEQALQKVHNGDYPPVYKKLDSSIQSVILGCFKVFQERWDIQKIYDSWTHILKNKDRFI